MKRDEKDIKWVEVRGFSIGEWVRRIFIDSFKDGFCLCVNKDDESDYLNDKYYRVVTCDGWREIKEPEYQAYTELTKEQIIDFVGKKVLSKDGNCGLITYCGDNYIYVNDNRYGLQEAFDNLTFVDGSVIGELKGSN